MNSKRFTIRSAVYLILLKETKVLLIRRYNTGWQDGNYTLIGGHIDGKETVTKAMIREAKEEAGIILDPKYLRVVHTMHRKSRDLEYIDFFLVAEKWKGKPKIIEDKSDDMQWFPLKKLPPNTLPYVVYVIKNYSKGISFSEFGWD